LSEIEIFSFMLSEPSRIEVRRKGGKRGRARFGEMTDLLRGGSGKSLRR
jgi:hypothetical protein